MLLIILGLSGVVTGTTIKAVQDDTQYPEGYSPGVEDYRKALQERAEREIEMVLGAIDGLFEAGEVLAFSEDPEEKKQALDRIEASNRELDSIAVGYQEELEVLQEKMETQMDALTTRYETTLAVNHSVALDAFSVTLREVDFEHLENGQLNNEVLLELADSEGASLHRLRGGETLTYKGYTIKYVSLIVNEETKGFEARLRLVKSPL